MLILSNGGKSASLSINKLAVDSERLWPTAADSPSRLRPSPTERRRAPINGNGKASITRVPERVLLFRVASGTEWERAGVTGATVTAMIVRGLIERDAAAHLTLTSQGRAAFKALITNGC
jgi:hypothetical protein